MFDVLVKRVTPYPMPSSESHFSPTISWSVRVLLLPTDLFLETVTLLSATTTSRIRPIRISSMYSPQKRPPKTNEAGHKLQW